MSPRLYTGDVLIPIIAPPAVEGALLFVIPAELLFEFTRLSTLEFDHNFVTFQALRSTRHGLQMLDDIAD